MSGNRWLTRNRAGSLFGLTAVTMVIAACGSSSGGKPSSPAKPASSGGSNTAVKVTIGTAKGSLGTYLVGEGGRALYLWAADSNGQSSCSGACAQVWTPLIATATPSVTGGVTASNLGWATRSGGQKQVTYNGHPLYYYTPDKGPGQTTGEGTNSFGAKWWLVSPAGSGITKSASSSSSSGGSSSGGSSGGGGGWG